MSDKESLSQLVEILEKLMVEIPAAIEAAYRDGLSECYDDGVSDESWLTSETKETLDLAMKEWGGLE
jgi:hypothetical protein